MPISGWALSQAAVVLSLGGVSQALVDRLKEKHPNLTNYQVGDIYRQETQFVEAAMAQGLDAMYEHLDDRAVLILASMEGQADTYRKEDEGHFAAFGSTGTENDANSPLRGPFSDVEEVQPQVQGPPPKSVGQGKRPKAKP